MIFSLHTYFSLKYGTSKFETLLDKSKELELSTLVLADINNTSGVFDFVRECAKRSIKPIVGIDFRNGDSWLYTCIANNKEGFREINEFLSEHNFNKRNSHPGRL